MLEEERDGRQCQTEQLEGLRYVCEGGESYFSCSLSFSFLVQLGEGIPASYA